MRKSAWDKKVNEYTESENRMKSMDLSKEPASKPVKEQAKKSNIEHVRVHIKESIKEPAKEQVNEPMIKESTSETLELSENASKQQPVSQPSVLKELGGLGVKIVVICLVFALIFTFFYGFHRVTNSDMSPMVRAGDLVLFYRLNKDYAIGDLLLVDFQGERLVQRVVAREGDVVDFENGNLVVNGFIQQEPEIFQETWQYKNDVSFPLKVNAGQVFVLADAREGATDGRVFGSVDLEDTLGTVITIIRRRNL